MSDIREMQTGFAPDDPEPPLASSKPKQPVTRHTIEVKADANGNRIDWEVDNKKPEQARLKLEKDSGAHEITFDLDADRVLKHRGLRFQCAGPIFVHDNIADCPTSGLDEQIEVLECSRGTLRILDKNSGPAKVLRYQLNFVEKTGEAQVCDPIIENGGGTRI